MDRDLDLKARLDAEADGAVLVLRRLFAGHPQATHFVLEYLVDSEHSVLAYAEGVDDRRTHVLFSGLQDVFDVLADADDEDGIHDLRSDEGVDETVTEWVQARWVEAGGRGVRCFLLRTGDSDLYDLNSQGWVSGDDVG